MSKINKWNSPQIYSGWTPTTGLLFSCCSSMQEVLNMLKESKADIFVDPVLHTACALDLKHHCAAITPGRGRRRCFHKFLTSVFILYFYRTFPESSLWELGEHRPSCHMLRFIHMGGNSSTCHHQSHYWGLNVFVCLSLPLRDVVSDGGLTGQESSSAAWM